MALLRTKEIRAMDGPAREKKLRELRDELMHERGVAAMGGAPPNPGKIRALRKNISRIYTVLSEEGKGRAVPAATRSASAREEPARKGPQPEKEPEAAEAEKLDEDAEEQP